MTRTTQASQGSKPWRLDNLPIYSVCEKSEIFNLKLKKYDSTTYKTEYRPGYKGVL